MLSIITTWHTLAAYGAPSTPPAAGFNPFGNTSAPSSQASPVNDDLNIDEMMKKIDARIAELEAEDHNQNQYSKMVRIQF